MEFGIFLVDTVVGQVLEFSVLRILRQVVINFSGKPSQSFLINVDSERVDACDTDVDSQIELKSVNKQRVVNVMADDQR